MRNKKAKALRRHAALLADQRVMKTVKGVGLFQKIVQKIVKTIKGSIRVDRVTSYYPDGHARRIYQDLKKGSKGIRIKKLCVI